MTTMSLGPNTTIVTRTLTAPANCYAVGVVASDCFPRLGPSNAGTVTKIYATAQTGTASPYCEWRCPACDSGMVAYRIDSSDGLPVELLRFGVN